MADTPRADGSTPAGAAATNAAAHRPVALVVRDHRRTFANNLFVYAVVSRRSKGVSIGVNLNPDKVCNFDCVYCQVDRRAPLPVRDVDVPRLLAELEDMLDLVQSGELFEMDRFRQTPAELRRLNDIAFSGDGEPTTCPQFLDVVRAVAEIKRRRGLDGVKLVLITNVTMFHRPAVREALAVLDANGGEVWAKLEAGTEAYYKEIDRTTIPFRRVLDNITEAAKVRPVVIQSLFLRLHGEAPPAGELEAFCDRLNEITAAGGRIKLVQVYTVARVPAESF
ncbi:MAG TPA: radical SAM protein, partial [Gemmataceae bacterium]|nr:radical SAM protein [Gemmataceae bacterium]